MDRCTQLPGDPDRRLAPPPSTYGLDDEAKLVASRQAVRLAGPVSQAIRTEALKRASQTLGSTWAGPDELGSRPDCPTLLHYPSYR